MGFVEAVRTGFSKYVDFDGRARRSEYWWWALFQGLLLVVLQAIVIITVFIAFVPVLTQVAADGTLEPEAFRATVWLPVAISWALLAIVQLGLLLPGLAVSVRRLHDTGRSGWWYWISAVPGGSIVLIVFAVQDSHPGPNEYGENPKGVAAAWPPAPLGIAFTAASTGAPPVLHGPQPAPGTFVAQPVPPMFPAAPQDSGARG